MRVQTDEPSRSQTTLWGCIPEHHPSLLSSSTFQLPVAPFHSSSQKPPTSMAVLPPGPSGRRGEREREHESNGV